MKSEEIVLNGKKINIITKVDEELKEKNQEFEDTIDLTNVLEQTIDLTQILNNEEENE